MMIPADPELLDSDRPALDNESMFKKIAGLALLGVALVCAQSKGVEGTWQGTLDAGAVKLRLGLHVSKNPQGEYTSTLDSIDQGAMGIPVKVTAFSGNALHLELPNLGAKYDGTLSTDGQEISGTFVQGAAVPLVFKRVSQVATLERPQNPKPPYPYEVQEVSYQNKTGIRLAGTLTVPRGQGPFAAAILITGSGPQDRDETIFGHKPFWVIADYLTRRGIAILRVDDRGVGGSAGSSTRETLDDMSGDVQAGVEFLKGRKEIDAREIGVIGHSEGGITGPAAAERSSDIAFVVMLAGTGVSGEQVLYRQGELIARASGAPEDAISRQHALQQMIFDILRTEKDDQLAIQKMQSGWEKFKGTLTEAERKELGDSDKAIHAQFLAVTSPEMRSFIFYDPSQALRNLKVPVLALNGSQDLQVPPSQNLPAIAAALAAGGSHDFTVTELPGLNHLFQKCRKCTPAEYGELEETFSPAALEIMGDWITRHTRTPAVR